MPSLDLATTADAAAAAFAALTDQGLLTDPSDDARRRLWQLLSATLAAAGQDAGAVHRYLQGVPEHQRRVFALVCLNADALRALCGML